MKSKTPLILIFITVFIDLLGFGILIPILPTFATKELNVDETAIGIAIAIYSLTQFFFNPIFGKLSDKYGRRPLIIAGLLLNAIGYVIFAFTHTFWMLLVSRIVAGIGGSSIAVAQAYIADVTTKENRSKGMGMIGAAFGLGFVFGPLFGGYLAEYGYTVTGYAAAAFSFLAFFLTLFFLPETNLNRNKEIKRKMFDIEAAKNMFRQHDLAVMVLLFFILTFSMACIYGTFALLGYKVYHFTDLENGYMYAVVGLSSAIVQGGLMNVISKFFTQNKIIIFGALFMMLGLGLMPYGGNIYGLAVIIVILSVGTGTLQPTILSLISEVTPEAQQGITLGLNQSFSAFARVLGPLWGGFAFEYMGYEYPFLTGALFTFSIMMIGIFYLPKILKKRPN
ncbi:MAG: MFS transporter [Ignavibacteriaceae bacterium]